MPTGTAHPIARRPLRAADRTHFTDEEPGVTQLQMADAVGAWSLGLPAPSVRHAGRWTGAADPGSAGGSGSAPLLVSELPR